LARQHRDREGMPGFHWCEFAHLCRAPSAARRDRPHAGVRRL